MNHQIHKDDTVSVIIESLSHDGRGVAHKDGCTIFVQGGIPHDEVQVRITQCKKRFASAEIISFRTVSPLSTVPPEHTAAQSGTAPLYRLPYPAQLAEKTTIIKNAFSRIGKINTEDSSISFLPIIGMDTPDRYRNKARYACGITKDNRFCIGSYRRQSNEIQEESDTPVYPAENAEIIETIQTQMNKTAVNTAGSLKELIIRTNSAGEKLLVFSVEGFDTIPTDLIRFLTDRYADITGMVAYNIKQKKSRCLLGRDFLSENLLGLSFNIPAMAFFQVNYIQTEKLYSKILEYAAFNGTEEVWDIYCGIGTISLCLAQQAHFVRGNEISAESIAAAKINAEQNDMTNVFFEAGAAEKVLKKWQRKFPRPDLAVLDPPRSGCAAPVIKSLLHAAPEKIIYVSCNPATLARDLALLKPQYRITAVQPVDMFPHTAHVECITVLERL